MLECSAYTQKDYEKELYYYSIFNGSEGFKFECNTETNNSEYNFISLNLIMLAFFLF